MVSRLKHIIIPVINILIIMHYFINIVSLLQSEQQKRLVIQFDEDE